MPRVFVDHVKADMVLWAILNAMRLGIYPFDNPDLVLPQDVQNLPLTVLKSSADHSVFATHSNYWMQGGNDSVVSYRCLKNVAEQYWDELFIPSVARHQDPALVAEVLRQSRLGFFSVRAQWWVENSEYIHQRFGGDTRNIFYHENGDQVEDWLVLRERMMPLKGFGDKIIPMNIYWHADAGIIRPVACPTPNDVHNHRLLTITGCVGIEGMGQNGGNVLYPIVMDACRLVTLEFCRRHNVAMEELADALWLFGRHMCSNAVGNRSVTGTGIKRRKGSPPEPVVWGRAQVVRHNSSCRRCVVAEHCKWCYRTAPYFTDKVAYLEPKPAPPAELSTLLPIGEPSFLIRTDAHRHLWDKEVK